MIRIGNLRLTSKMININLDRQNKLRIYKAEVQNGRVYVNALNAYAYLFYLKQHKEINDFANIIYVKD